MTEPVDIKIELLGARAFTAATRTAATGVEKLGRATQRTGSQTTTANRGFGMFRRNMDGNVKASRAAGGAMRRLTGLVGGLGIAFLGLHSAKDAVKTTVELGRTSSKLNKVFGTSAQVSGELAAAARIRGIEDKALTTGLTFLSKNTVAAIGGIRKQDAAYAKLTKTQKKHFIVSADGAGKQAAAFKLFGVSQRVLKSNNMELILSQTARGFAKMKGGPEKAAAATAVFGKGWQTLLPLIKDGRKGLDEARKSARDYGAVVGNPAAIKRAVKAQHTMEAATLGLKVAFAEKVLPALTRVSVAFSKFIRDGRRGKGVAGDLAKGLHLLGAGLSKVIGFFTKHKTLTKSLVVGYISIIAAMKAWAILTKIMTGVQIALNIAMNLNPVSLIVIGIIALIAVFVIAYKKVGWFRDAINAVFSFVKKHWRLILILITGPIGLAVVLVLKYWKQIKSFISKAVSFVIDFVRKHWRLILGIVAGPLVLTVLMVQKHWGTIIGFIKKLPGRISGAAKGMWNGVKDAFKSMINYIIDKWNGLSFGIPAVNTHIKGIGKVGGFTLDTPNMPRLAMGGTVTSAGLGLVGENGPEIRHLGRGASVIPLPRAARAFPQAALAGALAGGGGGGQIVTKVYLDKRQIAEAVHEHTADRLARR